MRTISIHAAREGGDVGEMDGRKGTGISIHAAREGGDAPCRQVRRYPAISIHAAREGGDHLQWKSISPLLYFNPRRP